MSSSRLCLIILLFFFNDTATTEIYTLSLHDALPILFMLTLDYRTFTDKSHLVYIGLILVLVYVLFRSEEHTSELQSHLNLVCRLLLEKKKTEIRNPSTRRHMQTVRN